MQVSTARRPPSSRKAGASSNQLKVIIAVVLLLIAGAICFSRVSASKAEEARMKQAADPQAQLRQIESNDKMPPQAKAMAAAMIRARMGETRSRSSQPH